MELGSPTTFGQQANFAVRPRMRWSDYLHAIESITIVLGLIFWVFLSVKLSAGKGTPIRGLVMGWITMLSISVLVSFVLFIILVFAGAIVLGVRGWK